MNKCQLARVIDVGKLLAMCFDAGLPVDVLTIELNAASICDVLAYLAGAERTHLRPLIAFLRQRARTADEAQALQNALDARDAVQLARRLLARLHPDHDGE